MLFKSQWCPGTQGYGHGNKNPVKFKGFRYENSREINPILKLERAKCKLDNLEGKNGRSLGVIKIYLKSDGLCKIKIDGQFISYDYIM